MHICSNESLKRPGYTYRRSGGEWVGYVTDFRPATINWKHIDGPLLHCTNGELHWLTWRERIRLFFGWTDIHELDIKTQSRP
jgi:hypothetical protein